MEEKKDVAVIDTNGIETLKEPMVLGDVFAKSGMFPDIKSQAQAVVKILAGRELGLSPMESMNSLYFVNNKLAMFAKVMASLLIKKGKYTYHIDKLDNTDCAISFFKIVEGKEEKIGESIFTWQDATKAGLVNKQVWKDYPRNMLFSRTLVNGIRWFAPDTVCGYSAVEELEDLPEQKPEVIEIKNGEVIKNG